MALFIQIGSRFVNVDCIGFFDDTHVVLTVRDEDGGSVVLKNDTSADRLMLMIEEMLDDVRDRKLNVVLCPEEEVGA